MVRLEYNKLIRLWAKDKYKSIVQSNIYRFLDSLETAWSSFVCLGKTLLIVPVISYSNADRQKLEIVNQIKGKSGVYRWINNISGKSYVGSSINLSKRLYKYYSLAHITVQAKHSLICKALVKYGYASFSFEILEYCLLPTKSEVLAREQYYMDLLKPEYNILKVAGSNLGYTHSAEVRAKMSGARNLSLEHLTKIRQHISKINEKRALSVEVFDMKTATSVEYVSIRLASRELNSNDRTITRYIKSKKPYQGRYIISLKRG